MTWESDTQQSELGPTSAFILHLNTVEALQHAPFSFNHTTHASKRVPFRSLARESLCRTSAK